MLAQMIELSKLAKAFVSLDGLVICCVFYIWI